MELRIDIDDSFIAEMRRRLGSQAKPVELIREGLTMFRWAVEEAAAGRLILSTNATGSEVKRLVMPSLSAVEACRSVPESLPAGAEMVHPTFTVDQK